MTKNKGYQGKGKPLAVKTQRLPAVAVNPQAAGGVEGVKSGEEEKGFRGAPGAKQELQLAVALQVTEMKKMLVPAFLGSFFGFLFYRQLGAAEGVSWFSLLSLTLAAAYYLQRAIFLVIGLNVKEFEKKDWFYVEFILLVFMMLSWTFLLN